MKRLIASALAVPLLTAGAGGDAFADNTGGLPGALFGGPNFKPITNQHYRTECSGCHVAFPPELLPADAWGRVIDSLKNHFGDDATLSPALTKDLRGYLAASAGKGSSATGPHATAAKAAVTDGPPRITDTTYFRNRHNEISLRFVTKNPKIGSFANCQACHLDATQGVYSEEQLVIPKMDG
jgi:hypothetical protein